MHISILQLLHLGKQNLLFPSGPVSDLLRSTKWIANLILACDVAELVALCKVIVWKTHIPINTQKWPPGSIFAGACHCQ